MFCNCIAICLISMVLPLVLAYSIKTAAERAATSEMAATSDLEAVATLKQSAVQTVIV